jgi:hypothetical protein
MKPQEKKALIYVVGGIAAYYLLLRPLLEKFGIVQSAAQAAQQAQQSQNVQTYINNTLAAQSPTKTVGEWQIIADQIYEDFRYSAISDNTADATYQICRAQNDADVATLIKTFGQRQETWFGVIPAGGLKDLQQFVTSNLSGDQIAAINDNYSRKGINYQF